MNPFGTMRNIATVATSTAANTTSITARRRSASPRLHSYARNMARKTASSACERRRSSCSAAVLRKRLQSIGVSVTDTRPDTRIAAVIVTANSRNRRPRMPLMKRIGMNTAASDTVIDTIVKPISLEPFSAASSGASPSSMCRTMFSSITMASSTTKPIERMSAIIERLSSVKPSASITEKVPRIENGSASAGISVADPL